MPESSVICNAPSSEKDISHVFVSISFKICVTCATGHAQVLSSLPCIPVAKVNSHACDERSPNLNLSASPSVVTVKTFSSAFACA